MSLVDHVNTEPESFLFNQRSDKAETSSSERHGSGTDKNKATLSNCNFHKFTSKCNGMDRNRRAHCSEWVHWWVLPTGTQSG